MEKEFSSYTEIELWFPFRIPKPGFSRTLPQNMGDNVMASWPPVRPPGQRNEGETFSDFCKTTRYYSQITSQKKDQTSFDQIKTKIFKGQQISKTIFGIINSSIKRTEDLKKRFSQYNFFSRFIRFLEELEDTKKFFPN